MTALLLALGILLIGCGRPFTAPTCLEWVDYVMADSTANAGTLSVCLRESR